MHHVMIDSAIEAQCSLYKEGTGNGTAVVIQRISNLVFIPCLEVGLVSCLARQYASPTGRDTTFMSVCMVMAELL